MRAIVVEKWTDPSELEVKETPAPEVVPGRLVIDVKATGSSFADSLLVRGEYQYRPPFPFVPGSEVSGVVRAVGEGVTNFAEGDHVFAAPGLGGYAEQVLVREDACRRLPEGMGFAAGTGLAVTYPTSYAGLVLRADLKPGEDLLVHAAAGGVGSAAVQIGKALGARVIATAGTPEKCDIALGAGADHAIDYSQEDFVARVRELTDGKGADVTYDPVGGDVAERSLSCIAWNGRLVIVGFTSGTIPNFVANRLLLKNCAVTGVHWDAYARKEPKRVAEVFGALAKLHAEGAIDPVVWRSFPLAELPAALEALGSRKTYGKVVVTP